MSTRPRRVGTAAPRARASWTAGAVVAIAIAAAALAASARGTARGTASLAFPGLAWGAPPEQVAARLDRMGFRRDPSRDDEAGPPAWRGRWKGEEATCVPESRAGRGLVAVTLRLEPGTVGEALRLYAALGADLERRHGPETVDLGVQRPLEHVHYGLVRRLARTGEPAGARLWTGGDGSAAALQLDGERIVWLRWEAPGWEPEFAPDFGVPGRR